MTGKKFRSKQKDFSYSLIFFPCFSWSLDQIFNLKAPHLYTFSCLPNFFQVILNVHVYDRKKHTAIITFFFLYSIVYCITFPRVILHCYHPGVWCLHNPRVPPDVSGNCHLLPFYCHRPVVGGNSGLLCWFSLLLETCKFWLMNIFLALVVGPSAYSGIYIGVWSYSALLTGHFSHFDQQHVFIMIFGLILISVTSFDLKIMIFLPAGATVYFTQPSLR